MQHILARLAKVDQLEQALIQRYNVTQAHETPPALAETSVTKQAETATREQPSALLPDVSSVSPDEVKSVVDAYLSGIAKRNICFHLKWSLRKYTSIVKPVLDELQKAR